jgi:hypothetical protein
LEVSQDETENERHLPDSSPGSKKQSKKKAQEKERKDKKRVKTGEEVGLTSRRIEQERLGSELHSQKVATKACS